MPSSKSPGQPPLAPPTDVSVADREADEPTSGAVVDLCVRSLSAEVQPLLDETLARLRDVEEVARVDVVVYGRSFDPTGPAAATDAGRALADRIDAFRAWAGENDASFGPFFDAYTVGQLTGERHTRVDLPTVTLAEYRDGEVTFVAPCWMGERRHTVLDRAARLAEGDPRSTTPVDVPDRIEPTGGDGASVRT